MCLGTNVSGHNRVWAQSCLGTIVSGRNRVWAQSRLGTIVSGHNRVWAQSCGPSRVGPIMYGHKRGGTILITQSMEYNVNYNQFRSYLRLLGFRNNVSIALGMLKDWKPMNI